MKTDKCKLCERSQRIADDARALLCGSCVQRLLTLSRKEKVRRIVELREKRREDAARAIEKLSGLDGRSRKRQAKNAGNALLFAYRKSLGLTQEQLASEWDISRSFIALMESGKKPIPTRLYKRIVT